MECEESCGQQLHSLHLVEESEDTYEPPTKLIRLDPSSHEKSSKQTSERICEESCGLNYGISEVFNKIVLNQQKINASESPVQPKIFNDPEAQQFFVLRFL